MTLDRATLIKAIEDCRLVASSGGSAMHCVELLRALAASVKDEPQGSAGDTTDWLELFTIECSNSAALEMDLDQLRKEIAESNRCEQRLVEVLRDIADHGLRFDLNPTVSFRGETPPEQLNSLAKSYLAYIKRMDAAARERAQEALREHDQRGAQQSRPNAGDTDTSSDAPHPQPEPQIAKANDTQGDLPAQNGSARSDPNAAPRGTRNY